MQRINSPSCRGSVNSNPEEFHRLKYETYSTLIGINNLVFILLKGKPVTLKAIFLCDPLYCTFMNSQQCTLLHRVCSFLYPCKQSLPTSQSTKMNILLREVVFISSCVFKIRLEALYQNMGQNQGNI